MDPFVHTSLNDNLSAAATHHLMLGLVSVLEMHLVRLENYSRKSQLLWSPTEAAMLREEQELEQAIAKLRGLVGQARALSSGWASLLAECGGSQPLSAAVDPANYRIDDWPPWADSDSDATDETEDGDDADDPEFHPDA